jgi:hypothetical protein
LWRRVFSLKVGTHAGKTSFQPKWAAQSAASVVITAVAAAVTSDAVCRGAVRERIGDVMGDRLQDFDFHCRSVL